MIGRLSGRLLNVVDNLVLLDVNGVGYEIEVPNGAVQIAAGDELVLHTHLVVREDAQLLYGFTAVAQRDLFRNLIRITGVGPKMALAILGTFGGGELARCVRDDDVAALQRVPGVGKKTAERLLVELRNRAELLPEADTVTPLPADAVGGSAPNGIAAVVAEVEQALIALGYKPQYATQVIAQVVDTDDSHDTQSLLRAALQYLAQKSEVG